MKGDKLAALAVSVCGHACVAAAAITYLGSAAGRDPRPSVIVTLAFPDARTALSTPMAPPAAVPPTSGARPAELQAAARPEAAAATVPGSEAVPAPAAPVEAHPALVEPQAEAVPDSPAAPEQGTPDAVAPIVAPAPSEAAPRGASPQVVGAAQDAAPTAPAGDVAPGDAAQEVGAVVASGGSPAPPATSEVASAAAAPLADAPVQAVPATPSAPPVGATPAVPTSTTIASAPAASATMAAAAAATDAAPLIEASPSQALVASTLSAGGAAVAADPVPSASLSPTSLPATAPVSPKAEATGPAPSLASLEAAPLNEPAPEQRVSLAPDLAQASWHAQIRDFLRGYDGGPCFYAVPDSGSGSGPAIGGFAAAPAKFVALDWAFKARVRLEPAIVAARIWSPQCGAVDFLRATARAGGAPPPLIEVERSNLHGDDEVRGRIVNPADRPLGLFLISETGAVQDVTGALVRLGGGARFAFRPDHPGAGGPFPQMLVAVAADAGIPVRPATSDDLFKPLLAHPEAQPSAGARLLLLTR